MSEHSMVPIVTSQGHPQKDVGFWLRTMQVLWLIPAWSHSLPFTPLAILSGFMAAVGPFAHNQWVKVQERNLYSV